MRVLVQDRGCYKVERGIRIDDDEVSEWQLLEESLRSGTRRQIAFVVAIAREVDEHRHVGKLRIRIQYRDGRLLEALQPGSEIAGLAVAGGTVEMEMADGQFAPIAATGENGAGHPANSGAEHRHDIFYYCSSQPRLPARSGSTVRPAA